VGTHVETPNAGGDVKAEAEPAARAAIAIVSFMVLCLVFVLIVAAALV